MQQTNSMSFNLSRPVPGFVPYGGSISSLQSIPYTTACMMPPSEIGWDGYELLPSEKVLLDFILEDFKYEIKFETNGLDRYEGFYNDEVVVSFHIDEKGMVFIKDYTFKFSPAGKDIIRNAIISVIEFEEYKKIQQKKEDIKNL
jgi:hypothetical protein